MRESDCMKKPLGPADIAAFDAAWHARWPRSRPIGYQLRDTASATWVRFHSLPESKRYADDEAEYDELLSRHLTLLTDLNSAAGAADLRVITVAWSSRPKPKRRARKLVAALRTAAYWRTLRTDPSDPDSWWSHLYVSKVDSPESELRALLLLVADWGTADVIIAPPNAEWLYHPYDGGGDVIAPDTATRDRLREKYASWLSAHPDGL
jgi:hypothetical protein